MGLSVRAASLGLWGGLARLGLRGVSAHTRRRVWRPGPEEKRVQRECFIVSEESVLKFRMQCFIVVLNRSSPEHDCMLDKVI